MNAPIIVTALLGAQDFAFLDGLRCQHFPPERNMLRAHLTMFHHLPPSVESELTRLLQDEAKGNNPQARLASLIDLGGGVAFGIDSPGLEDVRARIAERFAAMLMPQDRNPWRPHVTIQNKVKPAEAHALITELSRDFRPRPLKLAGLAAWRYLGGPWEPVAAFAFAFATGHTIKPPR